MTDNLHLFANPDDGEEPLDPDVALVSAYLAHELSPAQQLALEERFTTDRAFRTEMQPLLDAWAAPVASLEGGLAQRVSPLSTLEHAEGWQRFQREAGNEPVAVAGTRTLTRIAAAIALVVLPVAIFGQVVVLAARHPGAPGHLLAQRLVTPFRAQPSIGHATPPASPTDGRARVSQPIGDSLPGQPLLSGLRATEGRQEPLPRPLGSVVSTSPLTFGAVSQLVALPDGRVFVADGSRRTVLLLDSSLAHPVVVLDSTSGKQNSYTAGSVLMSFRGDSALWYEASARAFIVLEAGGRLGRVSAPPSGTGRGGFAPVSGIAPASSRTLGLIYALRTTPATLPGPSSALEVGTGSVTRTLDSAVVLRMNYETRAVDSLAWITTGGTTARIVSGGTVYSPRETAPFPFFDSAVATTDGSVVIFHAREFRLDWINPDGTRGSGSRLTYPWQPITDDDRRRLLDSINAVRQHRYDSTLAQRAADSIRTGKGPTQMMTTAGPDGGTIAYPIPALLPPPPALALAGEVPDFREPTGRSPLLADADNHVWILPKPITPTPGFNVWDIVSQSGGVIDRVRIPDTRSIAGFAPGVVFLVAHDAGTATLEKVRIK